MTRDDIICMAREAGFYGSEILGDHEYDVVGLVSDLERFAELVAAAEREACAKVCDAEANSWNEPFGYALADAIRTMGQG